MNYEAWLTREESDEPTGLKISGIPRVTLEKSDSAHQQKFVALKATKIETCI